MDLGIDDDSAVVTASSSGLGKASASELIENGANVVVNGRDEDRLDVTVKELNDLEGGRAVGVVGDLTKKEVPKKIIERAVDEFGGLDHVVTCAGGPHSKRFMETTDE